LISIIASFTLTYLKNVILSEAKNLCILPAPSDRIGYRDCQRLGLRLPWKQAMTT